MTKKGGPPTTPAGAAPPSWPVRATVVPFYPSTLRPSAICRWPMGRSTIRRSTIPRNPSTLGPDGWACQPAVLPDLQALPDLPDLQDLLDLPDLLNLPDHRPSQPVTCWTNRSPSASSASTSPGDSASA
ncbi:hypothetical protein JCM13210_23290 [Thermaerobacter litoralis]